VNAKNIVYAIKDATDVPTVYPITRTT